MARVLSEISTAGMRKAILAAHGTVPSRRFWSHWMDRALAPHETEMAAPHVPIAAHDIEPEDGDHDPLTANGAPR
jgi:hypothetical protein